MADELSCHLCSVDCIPPIRTHRSKTLQYITRIWVNDPGSERTIKYEGVDSSELLEDGNENCKEQLWEVTALSEEPKGAVVFACFHDSILDVRQLSIHTFGATHQLQNLCAHHSSITALFLALIVLDYSLLRMQQRLLQWCPFFALAMIQNHQQRLLLHSQQCVRAAWEMYGILAILQMGKVITFHVNFKRIPAAPPSQTLSEPGCLECQVAAGCPQRKPVPEQMPCLRTAASPDLDPDN